MKSVSRLPQHSGDSSDSFAESTKGCAIEERAVDHARPLRVIIIGSGISGILASIRFRQRIKNLDLCVYEKNEEIGGTWFENKYPGCACDIPAHAYQATFEPNKEWSQFYASSKEIHAYWKRVALKFGCEEYIRFRTRVVEAVWDETECKWRLRVQDTTNGAVHTDQCDILISATGVLNNWKWPNIPGLDGFKGKLMHSASWDESYQYNGHRVAVIGNGSSGIQILPAILPKVSHIDHYIRGRTWIAPTFAEEIRKRSLELENFSFTAEEIAEFKKDHDAYQEFRKRIELELQSMHGITIKGHPFQASAPEMFLENMKRRLRGKPELISELVPSFPPCCRRLTPGPGYLEALADEKVDVITSGISKVVEDGIITTDGIHHPVDMIICATGFDTTFAPRFPIIGRNNASLADRWKEVPETYLSLAVDGFPNYFITLGPNSALGEGNLLLLVEKQIDYFTQCVVKMQRENLRSMNARCDAVKKFRAYCEQYFETTVFSMNCRSWYKGGSESGRVTALWPGSSLHSIQVMSHPRWEDFEYQHANDNPNGWLGDGWVEDEKNSTIKIRYLDEDQIDYPHALIRQE